MRTALMIATCIVAAAAHADEDGYDYVSNHGDLYSIEANKDGFVLRSEFPKSWFVEAGADSRVVTGQDVHYFGKACDAYHEVFGSGKWAWSNGGFGAEYTDGFRLMFPRQELYTDHEDLPYCTW